MYPLGGIRTYLKYNYRHFPRDRFDVTLLANPSIEDAALERDMAALGIKVIRAKPLLGKNVLFAWVAWVLLHKDVDLFHSQGFISAFHVSLINWLYRKPHVLTIHGILEEKLFHGRAGRLKRKVFEKVIRNVSVFHAVGRDILDHLMQALFKNRDSGIRWVVIPNGIDPQPFLPEFPDAKESLCKRLAIDDATFIFGYFGRFMPEKGFDDVIKCAGIIKDRKDKTGRFVVMAVGSGDYELRYKAQVRRAELSEHFRFLPFQPNVAELMKGCDAVLMPSIWEAYPILTSEVLCCGVPLIASNCPGLREAVANTPAIQVPASDAPALADAMVRVMEEPGLKNTFVKFRAEAARRFDVKNSAQKLIALFEKILDAGST